MPTVSTVDRLPYAVLRELSEQLDHGATVDEVTAWLRERSHKVSRSAVGVWRKRWVERRDLWLEIATLVKATGRQPADLARDLVATELVKAYHTRRDNPGDSTAAAIKTLLSASNIVENMIASRTTAELAGKVEAMAATVAELKQKVEELEERLRRAIE